MKGLLLAGFTTLALSAALTPAAHAQPRAAYIMPTAAPNASTQLSPVDLVFLARNGYLRDQGVPSNGALVAQYKFGSLTAKELVDRAIQANRLPAEVAQDTGYIFAVDNTLQSLSNR